MAETRRGAGNQSVIWGYRQELLSIPFNKILNNLTPVGIYSGGQYYL